MFKTKGALTSMTAERRQRSSCDDINLNEPIYSWTVKVDIIHMFLSGVLLRHNPGTEENIFHVLFHLT